MNALESVLAGCPYCGEPIELEIDCSAGDQDYIEDCAVCCRPITVRVTVAGDGAPQVALLREDE